MRSEIEDSSGNVFQDIGLPEAEGCLAKAEIASQICALIKKKKISQKRVADLLNITQPKVSLLLRGHLKGFSLEKLFSFLNALGQNVNISVKPANSARGHMTVNPCMVARSR